MTKLKTVCALACIAAVAFVLPAAATAETASLTITNVALQYTDPSTGDPGTAFDISWPAIYHTPSYDSCSAQVTYNDGQVLSTASNQVTPDPNNVYTWVALPNATYNDVRDNPVYPTATQIQANCTLHRTTHYWQRATFSNWFVKRGSSRAWATGDCRVFVYISGTLTVDCRRALKGEQVAYYVKHPGTFTRCDVQWSWFPATPGGRHVSCYDRNRRTAEVLFNVSAGGRFTITRVSVLAHWTGRVRRSRDVSAEASAVWTNPSAPPPLSCPSSTVNYSGADDTYGLQEFTICKAETLSWTLNDTCNGGMYIDDSNSGNALVDSYDDSGSIPLPAGTYDLDVNACGNWTIHVG